MSEREVLPMFPLGLVALPGGVVPLRLFEPRYLQLHRDLLTGSGEFGILLIERGVAEAQGGEYFSVGTVVQLAGHDTLEDDTVVIVSVGTERFRIIEWLEDDPYPRAVVDRLPPVVVSDGATEAVESCIALFTRVRALASELGADVGAEEPYFADNGAATLYDVARMSPIQDLDRQRILEADRLIDAADILRDGLEGVAQDLEALLGEG